MNDKPKTPNLRFPEFREAEEWAERRLQEISVPVVERVGDLRLTPVSISAGMGFVPQAEKFGRDISGLQYRLYTLVRDGDFVYNKGNSLKFPQGCIYELQGWGEVAAPNVFICFRLKDGYVNGFFRYCFENNMHGLELRKHITSGARSNGLLNINKEDFFSIKIPTPRYEEQQEIADCMSSLDEVIIAEGRKLKAMQAHKKGLMQQLFPLKGESRPRLRFLEFRDGPEWEATVGGELFTNRNEDGEEGLPIYSVTVNEGMVPRASFSRNFYDIEDPAGNKKVRKGDIAYNMMRMWQGSQGMAVEDCMVSPAYVVLAPLEGVCSEFFAYLFKLAQSLDVLTSHSRGLTLDRLRLYFDDFKRVPLRVPKFPEQQRIAACLSSLDAMIAAQARKLDSLRAHKKGLMQQLFPLPEGV